MNPLMVRDGGSMRSPAMLFKKKKKRNSTLPFGIGIALFLGIKYSLSFFRFCKETDSGLSFKEVLLFPSLYFVLMSNEELFFVQFCVCVCLLFSLLWLCQKSRKLEKIHWKEKQKSGKQTSLQIKIPPRNSRFFFLSLIIISAKKIKIYI